MDPLRPSSPSLLDRFVGCLLGITILGAGFSRWFLVEMTAWEQGLCMVGALLMVAPSMAGTAIGLVIVSPMLWRG